MPGRRAFLLRHQGNVPSRSWNVPVGPVTVDCDVLIAPDSELYVVVFTAEPGTEDASRLDLLRVTGTQTFADTR